MKKLWTRWLALVVLVLLLGALFIRLGEWQLHRLEWRRGNNAAILAYEKQLPKPYDQVWTPGRTIAEHDQWQKVTVTGRKKYRLDVFHAAQCSGGPAPTLRYSAAGVDPFAARNAS